MIALDEKNATLFQDKISDLLPLIQSEYAEVLERVNTQITSRLCNEGDLTFALCILREISESFSAEPKSHCGNKIIDKKADVEDKLARACNDLINLISLLLSQQSINIVNGVIR